MSLNKRLIEIASVTPVENAFNVKTYVGTRTPQNITGVGFKPDLIWIKQLGDTNPHGLWDSTRGAGKFIVSYSTAAETGNSGDLMGSFNTDGFQVNSNYLTYTAHDNTNKNGANSDYVAWCWRANEGTTSSNTDGTNTSTVQANTDAGFSIVQGTASGGYPTVNSFGHGLGTTPAMIILKETSGIAGWAVWHQSFSSTAQDFLNLNTNSAKSTSQYVWGNSAPTSSVFSITDGWTVNVGATFIAYCFAEVNGYSKFGSYTSNATTKITTGFQPDFFIFKYLASGDWYIQDSSQSEGVSGIHGGDLIKKYFVPNTQTAENSVSTGGVEIMSDGFYPTNWFDTTNGVIYAAFKIAT